MMVHQVAQKLTAIDIQDSSAEKSSDSQEGVQGSGSEAITQLTAEHQAQILAPDNNSIGNHTSSDSILPESTQTCQELPKLAQACQEPPKPKYVNFLSNKNQSDIAKRGLLNDWARSTCRTVTAEEASLYLGMAKSGGILFTGQNGQIQFLPDKPWKKDGEKKPPKYRSPLGEYDAFLPPSPDNPLYWEIENLKRQAFYLNDHPYILITEGIFKAIAGCFHGIPTIALLGVEQGLTGGARDIEGKRFLVPALRILAEAGFGFIIAFDADALTNPNICIAQKKLAKQLAKFKVPVRIITGAWPAASVIDGGEVKNTKGMDDFIQHIGIEAFRDKLVKAKLFDENDSEPNVDGEDSSKKKKQLPPPSAIAEELGKIYREKLAWESEYELWRHYAATHDGLWDIETEESVKGLVHAHLRSQNLPGFTAGYVSSITTILKSDLEIKKWDEQAGLIPLRDGVLNQLTQELKPHAPGYRFTWQLPFKWADRFVGCEPIEEFLLKITGNQGIANVLLAFLSAVVTRRSDLQRYLELKGGGGTGKSTFMALARDLVGPENTVSSQLHILEREKFETARLYGKSLVLFPDSERWQGEVSVFKKLTGQDPIRYERKNVQQKSDFIFTGMVMLSANEAPETRDLTSGPERRKLTIELDIKVPEYADRELAKEFKPFLPGLLKRVLDISPQEVTRLIKYTEREVPALAATKWRQLCETNPIAGWLDEKVIIKPDAKAYIGLGDVEEAGRQMFASFCKWQLDNGYKNTGTVKWFSRNLRDLLKHQIKVDITEGRDRDGTYIGGIGLRCLLDPGNNYPRSVTKLPFCEGLTQDFVGLVKAETLVDAKNAGYAGFSQNLNDTENSQLEISFDAQKNSSCWVEGDKNPANPTHPTPASVPACTEGAQSSKNPTHPPKTSLPAPAAEFKVGDRVQVQSNYPGTIELRGQQAVVLEVKDNGRHRIDFGREIKITDNQSKRIFHMDEKYFHHVTQGSQLELPF